MPVTTDVTTYAEGGNAPAVLEAGATAPSPLGVHVLGGLDTTTIRPVKVNASGELVVSGGSGGGAIQNVTASDTTASIAGGGATGNLNLTLGQIDQILILVDVRPNTAGNNFEVLIYADSARTKLVYKVDQIDDDIFLVNECDPLVLPDGVAYVTIKNNHASARTFAVALTVEVRS